MVYDLMKDVATGAKYATSISESQEFANGSTSIGNVHMPEVLICSTHV